MGGGVTVLRECLIGLSVGSSPLSLALLWHFGLRSVVEQNYGYNQHYKHLPGKKGVCVETYCANA